MNDVQLIIFSIVGGTMVIGLMAVVLVIAGKEIYFAFKRRIMPKGNDIFVIDSNRQFSYYYMVPDKGVFWIEKDPYIANPDKILSLDEKTKNKIDKAIERDKKAREKIITSLTEKKLEMELAIETLKTKEPSEEQVNLLEQYKEQLTALTKRITDLKQHRDDFEIYYHKRRGAFLYVKGDPIPKNLHDWYTDMDATIMGNVIARAQSADPKSVHNLEGWLKRNQLYIYALLIGVGILLFLVFKNQSILQQIAAQGGVTLTL